MLLGRKPDEASLTTTLQTLQRRSEQEYLDKGLWVLYLGLGMLHWDDQGSEARSPLALLPVAVSRPSPGAAYEVRRQEQDALLNPALMIKLQTEHGIVLPTAEEWDESGLDLLFKQVEERVRPAGWEVRQTTVLAIFSFHKEVMFRDLLENEEQILQSALVQGLTRSPQDREPSAFDFAPVPEHRLDTVAPPEQLASVLDADASQRQCMVGRARRPQLCDGRPTRHWQEPDDCEHHR